MLGLGNAWLFVILGVAIVGATGGAYVKGRADGADKVIAQQAREDQVRMETLRLAQLAAAEEIARIQIVNRTIYAKATHEIVEKPVYRDCVHSPDTLGLLNDALTNAGSAKPAGDSSVPRANTSRW